MLTLILTLVLTVGFYLLGNKGLGWGVGGSLTLGLGAGLAFQIAMGFYFRKVIGKKMVLLQTQMSTAGEQLRRKYESLAQRGGNLKTLMAQAEREQRGVFEDAVKLTETLEPYVKWSLLLDRQIAALRMQFYYQMKDVQKSDEQMKKAFIGDPVSAAMQLVRLYQRGEDKKFDKLSKAMIRKFRTKGELLYALVSWIRVKQGRIEEAIAVLVEGKKQTSSETLSKNWDALVNGKIKQFSNAPLGEMWYVLQLEEPKAPRSGNYGGQTLHPGQRHMMMQRGGRMH